MAINLSSLIGLSIRSASAAMNASMIRFALKSYPSAGDVNKALIQVTLDCVPFKYLSAEAGFPTTPGWDSPAYVSSLTHALRFDSEYGDGMPDLSDLIRKIICKIERNRSIQEIVIQKNIQLPDWQNT